MPIVPGNDLDTADHRLAGRVCRLASLAIRLTQSVGLPRLVMRTYWSATWPTAYCEYSAVERDSRYRTGLALGGVVNTTQLSCGTPAMSHVRRAELPEVGVGRRHHIDPTSRESEEYSALGPDCSPP